MSDLYRSMFLPDLLIAALERNRDRPAVFIDARRFLHAKAAQRREPGRANCRRYRTANDRAYRHRCRLPDRDGLGRSDGNDDLKRDSGERGNHQSFPPGGGCGRFCCCFRACTFRSSRSALFSNCSAC